MEADFLDAHERHWQDAEMLRASRRWANSDHLYGFAAECGLKRLMLAFGMPVGQDGSPEQPDKVHADRAWGRYEAYRSGHRDGAAYALPTANPFSDWATHQRYARQAEFDEARTDRHRKGVESVRRMLRDARDNGLWT